MNEWYEWYEAYRYRRIDNDNIRKQYRRSIKRYRYFSLARMLKGLFLKLINPGTVLKGKSDKETSDFELNNIATTSPSFFSSSSSSFCYFLYLMLDEDIG